MVDHAFAGLGTLIQQHVDMYIGFTIRNAVRKVLEEAIDQHIARRRRGESSIRMSRWTHLARRPPVSLKTSPR